jgi:AAA+ ATPase superfamily predicted ATPase
MTLFQFADRKAELLGLENEYSKASASFVVVYGRRRVGKTALLRHFMSGKNGVYFLATQESDLQNRRAFQRELATAIDAPYLNRATEVDWELLFEEVARVAQLDRFIVVIDEFQYLGLSNTAFASLLQRIWDNTLKHANVMLILCGSLVSLMESQVLHYSSPLYGRRTSQIRLRPIKYADYHEFFGDDMSAKDLLWRYGATGGIPRYAEVFLEAGARQPGEPAFWHAVQESFLNRTAVFYEEPHFLLSEEVKELGNYFSVLRAISQGNHKLGDIARTLQVKEINLRHYLKTLIDLDLLARHVPITEPHPEKSKKSLYRIDDAFLHFWFRFVHPNRSLLEMRRTDDVLQDIKQRYVEAHLSYVYESVCLEDFTNWSAANLPDIRLNRFGKWWDRQTEIDLMAISDDTESIAFGECKLTSKPLSADVLDRLRAKASRVNWGGAQRKELYVLYSMSGFSDTLTHMAKADNRILLRNLTNRASSRSD